MKTCTKCKAEKPTAEFSKNAYKKSGLRSQCKKCDAANSAVTRAANPWAEKARTAAWAKANPERIKAAGVARYAANSEKLNAGSKAWYAANSEKSKATSVMWAKANPEKAKTYATRWRKANLIWGRATSAMRRASRLQATPLWADEGFIGLWYKGAQVMAQLTGEAYSIDHIVPLKSESVCGLHAHTNMQILTQVENAQKGNRHWPGMPL